MRQGSWRTALSALVSESWLSRIRTAAFGAVVIERLVRSGKLVVALFGTGRIAEEIVPMLRRTLQVAELRVSSRRVESMPGLSTGSCRCQELSW